MRIVIATGVYPPRIGGPAKYAIELVKQFEKMGHSVSVLTYTIEHRLPIGIRHIVFFLKILPHIIRADAVYALDTFSVGLPASLASKIARVPCIVRIGGDFLWESYIERVRKPVLLRNFYPLPKDISLKEKIIHTLTKCVFHFASALAFTTPWQKNIFERAYVLPRAKMHVVENVYSEKVSPHAPDGKRFVWAGRAMYLKNTELLEKVFEKVTVQHPDVSLDTRNLPHANLMESIRSSYAVVVPSISEVSPNLMLEAIQYGKPFIATRENGLYETYKEYGIFIDPLSELELYEAIVSLLDEKTYTLVSEKSQSHILHRSWADIANDMLRIAESV